MATCASHDVERLRVHFLRSRNVNLLQGPTTWAVDGKPSEKPTPIFCNDCQHLRKQKPFYFEGYKVRLSNHFGAKRSIGFQVQLPSLSKGETHLRALLCNDDYACPPNEDITVLKFYVADSEDGRPILLDECEFVVGISKRNILLALDLGPTFTGFKLGNWSTSPQTASVQTPAKKDKLKRSSMKKSRPLEYLGEDETMDADLGHSVGAERPQSSRDGLRSSGLSDQSSLAIRERVGDRASEGCISEQPNNVVRGLGESSSGLAEEDVHDREDARQRQEPTPTPSVEPPKGLEHLTYEEILTRVPDLAVEVDLGTLSKELERFEAEAIEDNRRAAKAEAANKLQLSRLIDRAKQDLTKRRKTAEDNAKRAKQNRKAQEDQASILGTELDDM